MRRIASRLLPFLLLAPVAVTPLACTQLQSIANLAQVKFSLDGARDVSLAGVPLDRVRSYGDLGGGDLLRLGSALTSGRLPLQLTMLVGANNPSNNPVAARLVSLDYTVLLDDREAFNGVINDQPIALAPGVTSQIPITARLDLMQLVGGSLPQLVDLALAIAGNGAGPRLKLVVQPTIDTPLGPIRYPQPITLVNRSVGSLRN